MSWFWAFLSWCPNRKALIIKKVEEIWAIEEESSEEEDKNDGSTLVTPNVGEMLLIKRSLHATKVPYEDSQREQIFNSRCTIWDKVYSLIIDDESCRNVASNTLIDKLQIPTKEHPTPYTLQYLGSSNEVAASRQTLISFSIGP